jgi:hypothetical protein
MIRSRENLWLLVSRGALCGLQGALVGCAVFGICYSVYLLFVDFNLLVMLVPNAVAWALVAFALMAIPGAAGGVFLAFWLYPDIAKADPSSSHPVVKSLITGGVLGLGCAVGAAALAKFSSPSIYLILMFFFAALSSLVGGFWGGAKLENDLWDKTSTGKR